MLLKHVIVLAVTVRVVCCLRDVTHVCLQVSVHDGVRNSFLLSLVLITPARSVLDT